MARTTLDIDTPLLEELKKLQREQRRSLGKIVSQLLAEALSRKKARPGASKLQWISRPMGALVDLNDKEAVYGALARRRK
jgi:hypothetical protein